MKIINKIATIIILTCLSTLAKAQSTAIGSVTKSVFTLTTFKADGSILTSSHGVFIDGDGTAISPWSPFIGAHHAAVIDNSGRKYDVDCMIAANELYDLVKFQVKGNHVTSSNIASVPAKANSKAWVATYSVGKANLKQVKISKVEKFMDKYSYYILSSALDETTIGCPLVDGTGNVIGIIQKTGNDTHATDINLVADQHVNGLTVNDPVLRQTDIRTALPDKQSDALISLVLSSQQSDSLRYLSTIEEFIKKFPNSSDGYTSRAQYMMRHENCAAATADMETAISKSTQKDEVHYAYAKLIYDKLVYKANIPYIPWTIDKAAEEALKAYTINPQPIYKHLLAQITYSKGDYQGAFDQFMALTKTALKNPELYLEAAQCKKQLQASNDEILQLLDSAVTVCKKPQLPSDAPYFLARASQLFEMGEYRKALHDFNKVDTLSLGRVDASFLYSREQCEMKCKLFQQALDDIQMAVILAPTVPLYRAEKANVLLRVGKYYEAIASATSCISLAPDFASAHLVLGLAQIQTGQKQQGLQSLQKAKDLGDMQAQSFIEKYK